MANPATVVVHNLRVLNPKTNEPIPGSLRDGLRVQCDGKTHIWMHDRSRVSMWQAPWSHPVRMVVRRPVSDWPRDWPRDILLAGVQNQIRWAYQKGAKSDPGFSTFQDLRWFAYNYGLKCIRFVATVYISVFWVFLAALVTGLLDRSFCADWCRRLDPGQYFAAVLLPATVFFAVVLVVSLVIAVPILITAVYVAEQWGDRHVWLRDWVAVGWRVTCYPAL